MIRLICYTDGSANCKNKLGGYGVYIKIEKDKHIVKELFFHEGYSNTTTSRMELMAIITCLQKIEDKLSQVFIYSDSEYAVNCIRMDWMIKWEKSEWRGVKNVDLLKKYLHEFRKFRRRPIINHIKGHQKPDDEDTIGNNIADALADYKQFENRKIDNDD